MATTGLLRRRRRLSALVSVAGVTATALAVLTAGTSGATADPISKTVGYTCTLPLVGAQGVTVTVNTDIPKTLTVGTPTGQIPVSVPIVMNTDTVDGWNTILAASLGGSAAFRVNIASPDGAPPIELLTTYPAVPVPPAGPMTVVATGTLPSVTFNTPGPFVIGLGNMTLSINALTSDGSPVVGVDLSNISCTPDAGQDLTLATGLIVGPTPTSTATPCPTGPGHSGSAPGRCCVTSRNPHCK